MNAIIFDMDGVISNTQVLHARIEEELLEKYNIKIKSNTITEKYAGMSDKEFFKTIFNDFGKKADIDKVIKEKWNELMSHAKGNISAIEGAISLIQLLKNAGFKLAVASASKKEFIDLVLLELNITKYFDVITSADEVKLGKPNPDIFLLAAKKLDVEPKKCIVIEDGKLGMTAAKRAGMKCIGLVNKKNINEDEYDADKIVKNLTKLKKSDFR